MKRKRRAIAQGAEAGAGALLRHAPVMLDEVVAMLALRDGGDYLDATFGAGGYSTAMLQAADIRLLAVDRDPSAIAGGADLVGRFAPRLALEQQPFGALLSRVETEAGRFAGIVFDLGVSSMQLDQAERGFSFQTDGPLDMRMFASPGANTSETGGSAADAVNTLPEAKLADILYQLGEERRSRAIAAAIVKRRVERPFERTVELVDVVTRVLGRGKPGEKHPATRTFQALRIWVNDELGELARGLLAAEALLAPGGRLVVVTFHSLEDRIVKRFLAERSGRKPGTSRHLPVDDDAREPSFRTVNFKSLSPSEQETANNPRARSARLRTAERTVAAAWEPDLDLLGLPEVLLGR